MRRQVRRSMFWAVAISALLWVAPRAVIAGDLSHGRAAAPARSAVSGLSSSTARPLTSSPSREPASPASRRPAASHRFVRTSSGPGRDRPLAPMAWVLPRPTAAAPCIASGLVLIVDSATHGLKLWREAGRGPPRASPFQAFGRRRSTSPLAFRNTFAPHPAFTSGILAAHPSTPRIPPIGMHSDRPFHTRALFLEGGAPRVFMPSDGEQT